MASRKLNAAVRNRARGGMTFRWTRRRLVSDILAYPAEELGSLSAFLENSLFQLNSKSDWLALAFDKKDMPLLDRLSLVRRGAVERNLLQLATTYVRVNRHLVQQVAEADRMMSKRLLGYAISEMAADFNGMAAINKQSLFAFRLFAALNANTHKAIADHFASGSHAEWVKEVFLYPLTFYFINRPSASGIDQVVAQLFPPLDTQGPERRLIRFLLRSDHDFGDSLSFKCFVALLGHPYDAAEILADHIEMQLASRKRLSAAEADALASLTKIFPGSRFERLEALSRGLALPFAGQPVNLSVARDFALDQATTSFLQAFFDLNGGRPEQQQSTLLEALRSMRWERYPTRTDFDLTGVVVSRYWFLTAGKLIEAMLAGVYMVNRQDAIEEYRVLLRLLGFTGCVNPFVMTTPRASLALDGGLFAIAHEAGPEPEEATTLDAAAEVNDRTWINRFHWNTRGLARDLRLKEWFAAARRTFKPSANLRFLSGIDWNWIDGIIQASRIEPFRDNPDAIYVLLLRVLEERIRDPNDIRFAMRPITARAGSVEALVEWLTENYADASLAFIRFVLTTDMILKMQLENFYAAALVERLSALEQVYRRFPSSDDLLTRDQFLQEQRTLTTALTLMTVDAAQFAVSWDTIKDDAFAEAEDLHKAFDALNKTHNNLSLLADFMKKAPLQFANKQAMTYSLPNKDWPAASIVASVINTFLAHPAHGIESILAVRIRHDNLRYEFSLAIEELKRSSVIGILPRDLKQLIPEFEPGIYSAIQDWVDDYMHTGHVGGKKALFDFIPTQERMQGFIASMQSCPDLRSQVDVVTDWLRDQLGEHLSRARDLFVGELKASIEAAIERRRAELAAASLLPQSATRVASALTTTLSKRTELLLEWFRTPAAASEAPLGFKELKLAVDGRYRFQIDSGALRVTLTGLGDCVIPIARENVRLAFDIWCELIKNALKYSGRKLTLVRVRPYSTGLLSGFVFSSLRVKAAAEAPEHIKGMPSGSATDALFGSGNSGLKKVAFLAASVAGTALEVKVFRRKMAFHVLVPFSAAAPGR